MEAGKQVIFKLGNDEYGIAIMYVNAIEKYTNVSPVPNAPSYIDGIINLRGDVIPVYSLRTKFGMGKSDINEETKLIVTKSNDIMIAIQVDSVQEIVEIREKDICEAPQIVMTEHTKYIDKVANIKGRMIILLNLDGVLSDREQEKIEDILNKQES